MSFDFINFLFANQVLVYYNKPLFGLAQRKAQLKICMPIKEKNESVVERFNQLYMLFHN